MKTKLLVYSETPIFNWQDIVEINCLKYEVRTVFQGYSLCNPGCFRYYLELVDLEEELAEEK